MDQKEIAKVVTMFLEWAENARQTKDAFAQRPGESPARAREFYSGREQSFKDAADKLAMYLTHDEGDKS